jgi:hypothetical protein
MITAATILQRRLERVLQNPMVQISLLEELLGIK